MQLLLKILFLITALDDISMCSLLKILFLKTAMDDVGALCYYCVTSISNNTCYDDVIDARYWSGHNNNASTDDVSDDPNNVFWCACYYWEMSSAVTNNLCSSVWTLEFDS